MKCFVGGATGFVGNAVAQLLVAIGHEVYGLTSQKSNVPLLSAQKIHPIYGDMQDQTTWQDYVRQADVIIHAAQLRHSARISTQLATAMAEADFNFTQKLLEHANECQAFIYTSGAWIYGNCKMIRQTEDLPLDPYAIAAYRLRSESVVLKAANQFPTMVLRLGMVYGNGGLFKKLTLDPMLLGKRTLIPGDGSQMISPIHAEDCARAYLACIEQPQPGEIFNVCDHEPISFETLVRSIGEKLKAKSAIKVPAWLIELYTGKLVSAPILGNTTIDNSKFINRLQFELNYPTYREGTTAIAQGLSHEMRNELSRS